MTAQHLPLVPMAKLEGVQMYGTCSGNCVTLYVTHNCCLEVSAPKVSVESSRLFIDVNKVDGIWQYRRLQARTDVMQSFLATLVSPFTLAVPV